MALWDPPLQERFLLNTFLYVCFACDPGDQSRREIPYNILQLDQTKSGQVSYYSDLGGCFHS